MSAHRPRICAVVVVDDAFLPGTLVMLHSLLEHTSGARSWDVVAFFDPQISPCSSTSRAAIAEVAPRVVFEEVERPAYRSFPVKNPGANISLLKLEAFRLEEYDAVLYLDTDLLLCASVQPLIDALCADGPAIVGVENTSRARSFKQYSFESFPMNAGLFAFRPQGSWLHAALLECVDQRANLDVRHEMVCQPVLNSTLAKLGWNYTAAPCFFNFRDLARYTTLGDRVVALHYISRTLARGKPWDSCEVPTPDRAAHRAWHAHADRVVADHPTVSNLLRQTR